ncbi:transporter [Escherichia coli]|nr:transporter [Escherichia coli]
MHSWKKKLVVSQLALACTLAITSQANAANYDTWTYIDNPVTALDWDHMDKAGTEPPRESWRLNFLRKR